MITREEYNKALDVIEKYQSQIFMKTHKDVLKEMSELKKGDYVRCKSIHQKRTKGLTIGNVYKIFDIMDTGYRGIYFYIRDDNGKKRKYTEYNSQFEVYLD